MTSDLFVVSCPLTNCRWTSDPMETEDQTREARRKHVSEHTHGDLVGYVCAAPGETAHFQRTTA